MNANSRNSYSIIHIHIYRRHVLLLFFCLQPLFSISFFRSSLRLCKCCCSVTKAWRIYINLTLKLPVPVSSLDFFVKSLCNSLWKQVRTVRHCVTRGQPAFENPGTAAGPSSYNFFSKSQNPGNRQQGDGFKGYKSSTVRLNHKVEQLWLCLRNML